MAREFDGPLSADDLVYLRSRYTEPYVQRQVDLYGEADGAEDDVDEAQAAADKAREEAEKVAQEAADKAQAEADEAAAEAARQAEEDLIGDSEFNVLEATEAEVKAWAADASDEDKAAALSAEQGRTDREPRKGVVSLLS